MDGHLYQSQRPQNIINQKAERLAAKQIMFFNLLLDRGEQPPSAGKILSCLVNLDHFQAGHDPRPCIAIVGREIRDLLLCLPIRLSDTASIRWLALQHDPGRPDQRSRDVVELVSHAGSNAPANSGSEW